MLLNRSLVCVLFVTAVAASACVSLASDNQDAISRLTRCKQRGALQDEQLSALFPRHDIDALLEHATPSWIPGHGRCRGNALADQHARLAADGEVAQQ